MPTISETGYAKLIANLKKFISVALQFVARYNPAKSSLKIESMQDLAARCDTAMLDVSNAKAAYKTALDEREKVFTGLNKLATRVMNAIRASDTTERIDADAWSIVRKIQGTRTRKRIEDPNPEQNSEEASKEVSVSQMSYDHRINNFQDLIQFLTGTQSYRPNEVELQVESLDKFKKEMQAKNSSVVNAFIALQTARAKRNELLFKPGTGLVDVATDAKAYMKSVFGPASVEFKQVSKLKFS